MTDALKKHLDNSVAALEKSGCVVVSKREIPYGVQLGITGAGESCTVNLYHSKKKGNSVVGSGVRNKLLENVLAILGDCPEKTGLMFSGPRLGTDEAGKGDYFGPLVVAGVACGERQCRKLVSMGAADSKKLSGTAVRDLYNRITEMDHVLIAVSSVQPKEYNSLFASYKSRGMNSLDILARAHGAVVSELLSKGAEPANIVIDKFCEMKRLKPWLPATEGAIRLMVRAEDKEPAVAAASVIARSVYLDSLSVLSERYSVELTPGAGSNVDQTGRSLVKLNGEAVLADTAKLHFANTLRITAGA